MLSAINSAGFYKNQKISFKGKTGSTSKGNSEQIDKLDSFESHCNKNLPKNPLAHKKAFHVALALAFLLGGGSIIKSNVQSMQNAESNMTKSITQFDTNDQKNNEDIASTTNNKFNSSAITELINDIGIAGFTLLYASQLAQIEKIDDKSEREKVIQSCYEELEKAEIPDTQKEELRRLLDGLNF